MEQKHNGIGKVDPKANKRINDVRKEINNLPQHEIETKAKYLKQNYYESGPKAMKLLPRRLRKQQAETTVSKIYDPKTNQPKYKPKEIERLLQRTLH